MGNWESFCSANSDSHLDINTKHTRTRNISSFHNSESELFKLSLYEDVTIYNEKEIFGKIQNCDDIIQCILYIHAFLTKNNISTNFDANKLRTIAYESCDNNSSTYLWHINALIAASNDLEHLLQGLEFMFRKYLGSKRLHLQNPNEYKKLELSYISSPFDHSLRKQKTIIQSKRRVTSRNSSWCLSNHDLNTIGFQQVEPEILSPFNVEKFSQSVDNISSLSVCQHNVDIEQ